MSGPTASGIGQSVRRREDGRFLVGGGRYVTDLPFESALHVAIVRSPHAHARIVGVDARPAKALAGVWGAFVLADLPELRGALPAPAVPAAPVRPYRQSPLTDGVARFAGEAVAVVVAIDPYRASDAAEALRGEYEPLPASVDAEGALEPGAPHVHPEWATNVAASVSLETGDLDAALRGAEVVVTRRSRAR